MRTGRVTRVWRGSCLAVLAGSSLHLAAAGASAVTTPQPAAGPATAEQSRAEHVDKLIRELGDASFAVRRRATRELTEIGVPAKEALLAARDHADPEVRRRVREILATVLEIDFQLRLEAFVTDSNSGEGHGLPGWERFRKFVGDEPIARRLFAEMQRSERALLDADATSPAVASELLDLRCQQIQEDLQEADAGLQQEVSLGSLAALWFVAADADVQVPEQVGSYIHAFSLQTTVQRALGSSEYSPLVRSLLGEWIKRPLFDDPATMHRNLILALRYDLKHGIDLARTILRTATMPTSVRACAVLTLARLGGKERLAEVESLLGDETVCDLQNEQPRGATGLQTQVRDIALAALIHLTDQDVQDYGFEHAQDDRLTWFKTSSLGFTDSIQRQAALQKWRAWSQTHAEQLRP